MAEGRLWATSLLFCALPVGWSSLRCSRNKGSAPILSMIRRRKLVGAQDVSEFMSRHYAFYKSSVCSSSLLLSSLLSFLPCLFASLLIT
jgi:hypothetical protein